VLRRALLDAGADPTALHGRSFARNGLLDAGSFAQTVARLTHSAPTIAGGMPPAPSDC
jgi:hypothetical protein